MTWRQMVPTAVTLAAMLAGFFSILVMLAMILDGIDGNLARRLKGSSELGAELDTYVDMTAFGIAPALLIYVVSLQTSPVWRVLMTAAIVMSGVVRLARFKASDPHRGQMGYSGLPITASAGWVAMFVFISSTKPVERFSLNQGPVAALFLTGVMVMIILQVSTIRYPKPTKRMAIFVPCVALVILLFVPYTSVAVKAAFLSIVGLGYVLFGPVLYRYILPSSRRRAQAEKAARLSATE